MRARLASGAAALAGKASRAAGRGSGGMIGGMIAQKLDPNILASLAADHATVLVTGTNGKSTTTRMLAAALETAGSVATNANGDNMDAGIITAFTQSPDATYAAIEVDELHLGHIADAVQPAVIVLLNLSRDQLDRVGEINTIERRLRDAVNRHPQATIIANCDDVLMTSVAWDHPNVVWVSAGSAWVGDSSCCPRSGSAIIRSASHWQADTADDSGKPLQRPDASWWCDSTNVFFQGEHRAMQLSIPGNANRGNATQALAAARTMGANLDEALAAIASVADVAGRYKVIDVDGKQARMLLAKNPAGWQEALSMVDRTADTVVIAVNGQVADGEDLSWLWDVRFENFDDMTVVACGERGSDLSVRLAYAGVAHIWVQQPLEAVKKSEGKRVEVLANYTAFRDLNRAISSEKDN